MASYLRYIEGLAQVVSARVALRVEQPPTLQGMHRRPLVVLLHGLQGSPADLSVHRELFGTECAVYTPWVHKGGNCPLADAAAPVHAQVVQHLDRHGPTTPVALIGLSNGGRIAAKVETMLRDRPNPVLVATLATPFLGTTVMDRFGPVARAVGWYSDEPVDDMSTGSAAISALLDEVRRPTDRERLYVFAVGEADGLVQPVESALPNVTPQRHATVVVPEHCHASIAGYIAAEHFKLWQAWRDGLP